MTVRPAEETDIQEISKVARNTFRLGCPSGTEESAIEAYCRQYLDEKAFSHYILSAKHHLWVGIIDNVIAGYCLLTILENESAEISKLYLSPEFHMRGLGRDLLGQAVSRAKSLRVKSLSLSVFSGNRKAKSFYEKMGFRFIRTTEFRVGSEIHLDEIYEREID